MKILFVMLHVGFLRNYESTLRLLARRGHRVHVAYEAYRDRLGERGQIERLRREFPSITFGELPGREQNAWTNLATVVRILQDYLRYFDPHYATAEPLRRRIEKSVPVGVSRVMNVFTLPGRPARRGLVRVLQTVEAAIPLSEVVGVFLHKQAPDVVLVTPLVELGSNQVDYIKSAAALGIPTGLCVASWDNLTNKGVMRIIPDRIFVWNEAQKVEAIELHGAVPERVIVTGAQAFDHWFDWSPHWTRDAFCRLVGLDPDRPFVLYVGSSFFIAPDEAPFVDKWIRRLRAWANPTVASLGVLIRPHPTNIQQWLAFDFESLDQVALWPKLGAEPFTDQFKAEFYDSIYHSSAVVGVNTSAMIEAGIVGRAVCTVRAPEFKHSQDGTLHFQLLVSVNGGLLHIAETFDEHFEQLRTVLAGGHATDDRSRGFVQAFVRPFGLDVPATPILVEAIEQMSLLAPSRAFRVPAWASLLRVALHPVAWAVMGAWRPEGRGWNVTRTPVWVNLLRAGIFLWVHIIALPYFARIAGNRARSYLRNVTRRVGRMRLQLRKVLQKPSKRVLRAAEPRVLRRRLAKGARKVAKAILAATARRRRAVVRLSNWIIRRARSAARSVRRSAATLKRTGGSVEHSHDGDVSEEGALVRNEHEHRPDRRPSLPRRALARLGRIFQNLFNPDCRRDRKQLLDAIRVIRTDVAESLRAIRKQESLERDAFAGQKSRLDRVTQKYQRRLKSVEARLRRLTLSMESQARMTGEMVSSAQLMARHRAQERQIRWHLRRIAESNYPIIIGPWTGEIGFELLYWIPFVNWAKASCGLETDRLIALSRGGPASWYRDTAARHLDVLDFATHEELRTNAEQFRKQAVITPLDRVIMDRVTEALGVQRVKMLHPSLMYRLFTPVWRRGESLDIVEAFTRYQLVVPPADRSWSRDLPADYIAVKWYFSTSFPDTPENRAFASRVVNALSRKTTVVLLKTGLDLDDHLDYEHATSDRVRVIGDDMTPANNLDVQTDIIGRARAFVGTYGGFSYLAPLLGVNTLAFFSNRQGFRTCHLELAQRVFRRLDAGAFIPLYTRHVDVVRLVLDRWGSGVHVDAEV